MHVRVFFRLGAAPGGFGWLRWREATPCPCRGFVSFRTVRCVRGAPEPRLSSWGCCLVRIAHPTKKDLAGRRPALQIYFSELVGD